MQVSFVSVENFSKYNDIVLKQAKISICSFIDIVHSFVSILREANVQILVWHYENVQIVRFKRIQKNDEKFTKME